MEACLYKSFMKTLKTGRWKCRQPRPQWPGCFCRKMSRSNTCRKSHFVRKIHTATNVLTLKNEKPWRGDETTDGGITPGIGYTDTRKPCKGERWSFVPSALRLVVCIITGIIIPACGLVSLSGLCLTRRYFPLRFPQWFLAAVLIAIWQTNMGY